MDWKYLHLIKGDNINVAYCYPTSEIFVLNDLSYQVVSFLKQGRSIENICGELKLSENKVLPFIEFFKRAFFYENELVLEKRFCEKGRTLHRITLHVSNDCNLRCKYCYANGGNYGQKRNLMSKETASAFVKFCTENFSEIDRIAFFGGEPLLNVEIMEYICNQFKSYYAQGNSSFIPQFGIITNGTIVTPQMLNFFRKNISNITVSIDGPKEANDANRIYKDGKGSYENVCHFIRVVQEKTNIPIRYEATFTQSHIDAGYKYSDIIKFFFNEFGIKGSVVDGRKLDVRYILDYWKSLDYDNLIKTNFENMPEGFWGILSTIVSKGKREICPLIKDIFAIGVDGTIYPCHMLNGIIENSLGNIADRHLFNVPSIYESCRRMMDLKQNEICKQCWAQNLCGGCAVNRFYKEETKEFAVKPKMELCKLYLQHLEQIILLIAMLRKNPLSWKALLSKANDD